MRKRGEGPGNVGGENFCASVRAKLLCRAIYCSKISTNPESQSGSRSRRGLGRRSLQIMQDYDLANKIAIRTFLWI